MQNPQAEQQQVLREVDLLIDFLEADGDPHEVALILRDLVKRSTAAAYAIAYPETLERMM